MYTEARQNFKHKKRFLGIRNLSQSRRTPEGEDKRTIALSEAINVDIDDEGGIISRPGYTKVISGTNITSAYFRRDYTNSIGYYIDSGHLYRILPDLTTNLLGTVPATDTYWSEAGNKVFLSTGYIVDNNSVIPLQVPIPSAPIVFPGIGNLPAGQYQVVLTTIMPDGRESGCSPITIVNIPTDGGSLQIQGTTNCNVYCTMVNGDILYLVGYQATIINSMIGYSYPLDPELVETVAIPNGITQLTVYNSSLYYAVYDPSRHITYIGWSKPFRYHVADAYQEYIQIAGEVRLMAGLSDVLLIGTDKEIKAYNEEGLTHIASYGVPKGHNYQIHRDGRIRFQTNRGVCTWPFENLSGDKVALPMGLYVGTGWVEMNGLEKFITMTDGSGGTDDSTIF